MANYIGYLLDPKETSYLGFLASKFGVQAGSMHSLVTGRRFTNKPDFLHITERYDPACSDGFGEKKRLFEVYGYATDDEGMEAFLVTVDGRDQRPDGNYYHLTWSYNARRAIPAAYRQAEEGSEMVLYQSRHANIMLKHLFRGPAAFVRQHIFKPFPIAAEPVLVLKNAQGHKEIRRYRPDMS